MNKTKYLAQKQLDIEERELFVTATGLIATLTVVNLQQHLRILSKISIYFLYLIPKVNLIELKITLVIPV